MTSATVPLDRPSFLIIELCLTLIITAAAFCWPNAASEAFLRIERLLCVFARRRIIVVLMVGLAALVGRLAILPWVPIPEPDVHDEFSYLLTADTFASGRLTNPTHPMWEHLESFHITMKPTYMSMYFPAQGFALAAGKVLAGHPWYGVLLSTSLMCAAICWMLQGWLPPGWALLGGMLAVVRLALFSYWSNSYWGGAMPALGGALVLGAFPRIIRSVRVRDGLLLALGVAILANSRPYEGLLLCVPMGCALAWWAMKKSRPAMPVLLRRMIAPAALLLAAACWMGYYNHRVFGSALTLPYQINRATYALVPQFLWQSLRPEPQPHRHEVMREFYAKLEMEYFQSARTFGGLLGRLLEKALVANSFLFGFALLPPMLMFPRVLHDRRVRFLLLAGVVYAVGLSLNVWLFPHFLAPFISGVYVLLLQAMRHLRFWRPEGKPVGVTLLRSTVMLCIALGLLRLSAGYLGITLGRSCFTWHGSEPEGIERAQVLAALESRPGRHLAIVRYAPGHSTLDDWVYNAADIDGAKVVWAREMDPKSDRRLLQYFRDRRVWLVQPDSADARLTGYPANVQLSMRAAPAGDDN